MSQAFARIIVPLGSARAARVKAWHNWRTCLTWEASWALARNALGQLRPMPTAILRAMLWDFITLGATNATLKSIVDAVIARRHRDAQLPSPVSGNLAYQRLTSCLTRVLGTQRPHKNKMGVTRDMVVRLLQPRNPDLHSFCNSLVTCTLTMGCMRPPAGKGALAQSCDFLADARKGPQFEGCSTLCT
jgi:hypothetical protein